MGTGYVGSVTGACLAERGNDVTLVDIDQEKVDTINEGRAPIEERDLNDLVHESVIVNKNLRATKNLGEAVITSDVVLLCLPTPQNSDGSSNLRFVYDGVKELGEIMRPDLIIATRSTVPVGTTYEIGQRLTEQLGAPALVANNPEFLAEGTAVADTRNPSRIIIGTDSEYVDESLRKLYHGFVEESQRILTMDPLSSEMSKLFANGILASDITFSNIIAQLCEQLGADFTRVREGASFDPRIGRFTKAGPGFGGSCFPKDIRNIATIAREEGIDSTFLDQITEVNEFMMRRIGDKVRRAFDHESLEGKTFAVLGIAFKANTDDVRESPAITLINDLVAEKANVIAYDPKAMTNAEKIFKKNEFVRLAENKYDAVKDADGVIIMTEWPEFSSLDLDFLSQVMRHKVIIDARHMLKLSSMRGQGFYYDAVGRPLLDERKQK